MGVRGYVSVRLSLVAYRKESGSKGFVLRGPPELLPMRVSAPRTWLQREGSKRHGTISCRERRRQRGSRRSERTDRMDALARLVITIGIVCRDAARYAARGYRFFSGLVGSAGRSLIGAAHADGALWWDTPRRRRRLDQEILGRVLPTTMLHRRGLDPSRQLLHFERDLFCAGERGTNEIRVSWRCRGRDGDRTRRGARAVGCDGRAPGACRPPSAWLGEGSQVHVVQARAVGPAGLRGSIKGRERTPKTLRVTSLDVDL